MSSMVKQIAALLLSAAVAACGSGSSISFRVGGSVAGLAPGSSVRLLNNGADSLTLASNGNFFFAKTVGSTYAVTVGAHPFWQNCAVVNGSGTTVEDVTTVTVTCVNLNAVVTTLAGSTTAGSADGVGDIASFDGPYGVALDGSGNVYVADINNNLIRKVTAAGVVTTLAGSTTPGSADGMGASASFREPYGVAVNSMGDLYVVDRGNHLIRKITAGGVVTTFAGSTTPGYLDGTGASASFSSPNGVAVDANDNIYVADRGNNVIRKITPAGVVTTLAGSTTPGSADGTGASASFDRPTGVAVDANGNVFVGAFGNPMVRKITPAGVVTTLAGSVTSGAADGTGASASFNAPVGVAVDAYGNVYVADRDNNLIRKITAAGVVTTLAGSTTPGSANGTGASASFRNPTGVAVDANGTVFVADRNNHLIRKITPTL